MKPQAGGNRKPGGSNSGAAAASGTGGAGGGVGRQNIGRGRNNAKGPSTAVALSGVYANMRMVHVLTSVVGTKCDLKVKNGLIYEGVFKTYGPECDIVLDAAHRKSVEPNVGPRREDIVESIIFKSSDVVVVHFKDVDLNYAKKDNFTDSAVSARLNGEHKEKDLEPWDGGEQHISGSMESLDTDLSNGWDPDEMFKYNEETYGVKSTYDSSLSSYTVPLERDDSEEFLKREARASQLAEEIEASATYKARVALENDDRSEEEKYTAVVRGERELHSLNRENKYIPPSQRNREPGMSWGAGRQNSPRLVQCSPGPPAPRSGPHDYNAMDQRVVNGGPPRMSPKSQRTPRPHRVASCRGGGPPPPDYMSQGASVEVSAPPPTRNSSSGGTWSSVVSGAHRPRSPRQNSIGGGAPSPSCLSSPQAGTVPVDSATASTTATSPTAANPATNLEASPIEEAKESRVLEMRQNSPNANKENVKPIEASASIARSIGKGVYLSVRKSTLNPNAKEFNPRVFCSPPKPATTPTQTRPQGQPSPSIVVQQPPAVYGQTMFQMYPLTPVSPGVQVPHMTMSQTKPYRPGKVPNMPQQRPDQHHPPGASTMMHPATAAGPPIVAPSPAYSTQYFTCSPQQFASQPLVQQMPHYQSQHVFSPMIQGSARMITPPGHAQPSLVSSSTTQYGEQTHTMYVSPTPIPQQFPHPSSTLHPHPQHPQPSATPTGQPQQGTQHGGSHPAPSPVQHPQHQAAAQAIHLGNPPQQQMYSALAPTPPSMTPGPNPQSPQASFPSAQQAVYIHPQQMQHGYNPNHMAHVQQAHMQSGMVPPHHGTPSHPPTMMLMATQAPAGPQPGTLNPIPVSSATHYSYTLTPVQGHHQQQL
uniref:Ataxin 2 n=2 Tax=Cyprinus carpio TaxID=7962 RepID=A0A8C1E767_CYPCA